MLKIEGRLGEDYEAHRTNPENGVASQEVFPALALAVPPPFFWDGAIPPGVREQFAPNHLFVPPIQVDRFDDAIVAGAGLVFTRNGRFLHGHVPVGGGESQFLAPWTELNLQPTGERDTFSSAAVREPIDWPSAITIARAAPGNYHHVLFDIAPRLHNIRAAQAAPGAFAELADAPILVNTDTPDWALDIFKRASGFPAERFQRIPRGGSVRAKSLIVPQPLNNFAYWVSPETQAFYADCYAWARSVSTQSYGPRIFTLRREVGSARRRPHNVDEVAAHLEARGFREIVPGTMSWADQIVAFHEATHVVAAMGSNVSNMIFSPRGARVLILHPNDSVYCLNVGMAAAGGQEVGYLWCECFSNPSRGEHVELYVDPRLLARGVDALLGQASA